MKNPKFIVRFVNGVGVVVDTKEGSPLNPNFEYSIAARVLRENLDHALINSRVYSQEDAEKYMRERTLKRDARKRAAAGFLYRKS